MLENKVQALLAQSTQMREGVLPVFQELLRALEAGSIRAAEKVNGEWKANTWVKAMILLGFKHGVLQEVPGGHFFDKDTIPLHPFSVEDKVRIVPGGTSIRSGCYVAPGTIVMPPSYINIGVYIDTGCMIDSHALVGSCAQLGKNIHLSAASQIGGVLEPVQGIPVILEDNVFVGGNCGLYEGVIVREGAVLASGVILTASTPVFDSTTGEFIRADDHMPLVIPPGAVVVSGSRPLNGGEAQGIQLYCPVIVKYRDACTAKAVQREELLRT